MIENSAHKDKTVLVTGASGMIGGFLVRALSKEGYNTLGLDCCPAKSEGYIHITADLSDKKALEAVFENYTVDKVIHLAALAHTGGQQDLSYERYYKINVTCAANIFEAAFKKKIPVLYISTADVYGFVKGVATPETELAPVSVYGKTKALAESELKRLSKEYDIAYTVFRFAPVYTDEIKRDIQKRYYLKYPNLAYIIGKGTDYEFLHINTAVKRMVDWVGGEPLNDIQNIKDEKMVNTAECIGLEKAEGRAVHVIKFPLWFIRLGFGFIKLVTGKNKYTYLLNKAVNPLRTE